MNIGIYQIDGPLPNLALMQIAGFHEAQGDHVEWVKPFISGSLFPAESNYDRLYASKIFGFSKMPNLPPNTILGGTGIDFKNRLPEEIANARPSYSLYPKCNYHIGFSMKGCRFSCAFCCVPQKEGRPVLNSNIDDLLINPNGGDRLMLLDNDFFGGPEWEPNLRRIIELKLKVCFVQGLNIRIITKEQAELLAKCHYRTSRFNKHRLTFAWDQFRDEEKIMAGINLCIDAGIKPENMQFFVLIGFDTNHRQNHYRVLRLREIGAYPYAMPYDKYNPYQAAFCRWVNHKAIFKSVKWEDYDRQRFTEEDMIPARPDRIRQ